jgi:beta-phosphoglucomutase-like phosphatase (HAD superfamily)
MDRLGLPPEIRACLFDLDGVLTETATLHAKAWQKMFDGFLSVRARSSGHVPFDVVHDYDRYVDGKPRDEGTRDFLVSRGIHVPDGRGDDAATAATIAGLGRRKNSILLASIREQGIPPVVSREPPVQPPGREPRRRSPGGWSR